METKILQLIPVIERAVSVLVTFLESLGEWRVPSFIKVVVAVACFEVAAFALHLDATDSGEFLGIVLTGLAMAGGAQPVKWIFELVHLGVIRARNSK